MNLQVSKGMYHEKETRYNFSDLPTQLDPNTRIRIEQQAQSIACLVHSSLFIETPNQSSTQYHISPHALTLARKLKTVGEKSIKAHCVGQKRPLVQEEIQVNYEGPFKDELSLGDGTAFLVGKQLIFTAAHCICNYDSGIIDNTKLVSLRVLFGFQTDSSGEVQTTFESKDIYRIDTI